MKKSFSLSLLLIILCLIIWLFWPFLPEKLDEITTARPDIINIREKKIFAPPPLKVIEEIKTRETFLNQAKIIELTNQARISYGQLPLQENLKLNSSARAKIEDMLALQYFEHRSPSGKEVSGLADDVSYEFITIGENLAMGNFADEEMLMEGWLNSPGHRENILSPMYQEIGVAAKKGEIEDKVVWLIVQHFGLPITACDRPDKNLENLIGEKQKQLETMEDNLFSLRMELQKIKPKWSQAYQDKAEEYNLKVDKYNKLLSTYRQMVEQYNSQVTEFNQCLEKR